MNVDIHLKNDTNIPVNSFKEVKRMFLGGVEEISDPRLFHLSDDSSYTFIGTETAIVRGVDILYVVFKKG